MCENTTTKIGHLKALGSKYRVQNGILTIIFMLFIDVWHSLMSLELYKTRITLVLIGVNIMERYDSNACFGLFHPSGFSGRFYFVISGVLALFLGMVLFCLGGFWFLTGLEWENYSCWVMLCELFNFWFWYFFQEWEKICSSLNATLKHKQESYLFFNLI